MEETQQQHGSALLAACQGLTHSMSAGAAAGRASPQAAAPLRQTVRRGREHTDSERNTARKGVSETEKESQRRSGYLFDNARIQAMVALRESAASPPRLLPEQYGLDLYIGLLKLTAVPPATVDSLSAAGLRVDHVLAVFLTDLKVTYDDAVDGLGAAATPLLTQQKLSFDHNLSDQQKCNGKLKQSRRRVTPSAMGRLKWKENRAALSRLIGEIIDDDAGVALTDSVEELFTRVWKEPAFTVAAADRTWVGLVRSWLGAADRLVTDAGAAPYQDAVVTGELIRATLTDDPSKRVLPPSLQNYSSLEANEQARRAVIMDTVNDRLVAVELAQLESAHRKVVGGSGGGSGGGGGAGGGNGGNGTGGGGGSGAAGGGGKAKAAEPPRAGDAGEGDGNDDDDDDAEPAPRQNRHQRRRETQSAHGANSAEVNTMVSKTIEEPIRAGSLSGAPGGVPSAGPHDRPFVIDPEVMSKASAKGLESCGSIPKPLYRRCNTWMFCGKPFMGKTLKCQKDQPMFDHEAHKDDTALPAVIFNSMTHKSGFVREPPLDSNAKKWAMYNALIAMPEGTVKTVREWLK